MTGPYYLTVIDDDAHGRPSITVKISWPAQYKYLETSFTKDLKLKDHEIGELVAKKVESYLGGKSE